MVTNKTVELLLQSKEMIISELRSLIEFYKTEAERERKRAELAVDELLRIQGKNPVMPDKFHIPTKEERELATKRAKEMELIRNELEKVGDTGGDPEEKAPVKVEEIQ